jgi:predicted amidophosphoribosyltransferase
MAAFCECCGAKITLKPEACPVCGAPRHGMSQREPSFKINAGSNQSPKKIEINPEPRKNANL